MLGALASSSGSLALVLSDAHLLEENQSMSGGGSDAVEVKVGS